MRPTWMPSGWRSVSAAAAIAARLVVVAVLAWHLSGGGGPPAGVPEMAVPRVLSSLAILACAAALFAGVAERLRLQRLFGWVALAVTLFGVAWTIALGPPGHDIVPLVGASPWATRPGIGLCL